MQQMISHHRTMFLFHGIAAILFGILTLVWPGLSLVTFVLLFGVFALIGGITSVAAALHHTREQGWGFLLFQGILGILAGVIALVSPGITAITFLYLIASWAILIGIMDLLSPLTFPISFGRGLLMIVTGLLSIVFGIVIAERPASGLLSIAWLIGSYAVVIGIAYVIEYFQTRSLETSIA